MSIDFSPVKAAGIPVTHFAALCGVSRITASTWIHRRHAPRGLYGARATYVVARISAAVDRGDLPLPATNKLRGAKLLQALASAIRK